MSCPPMYSGSSTETETCGTLFHRNNSQSVSPPKWSHGGCLCVEVRIAGQCVAGHIAS
jgi:hypothetical protein